MKPVRVLPLALLLALPPATALADGPSAVQLAEAIRVFDASAPAGPVRHLRCTDLQERETRMACFYDQQSASGGWSKWATTVLLRDSRWIVVQKPAPVTSGGHR
jgi:hypothetical protein